MTRCGCGRDEVQRRILTQDRALQLLQSGTRLDTEILDEDPARVPVDSECLRLPTRPVQRRHQASPQPIPKGVPGDERLELPDQLVVAPEGEVGVDPELERREAYLLEPRRRSLCKTLVGEIRERRAPPQRERVA